MEAFDTDNSEKPRLPVKVDEPFYKLLKSYGKIPSILPVTSPLFTELISGRLEYPYWRIKRVHDRPLEPDTLAVLVYCAIAGILPILWGSGSTSNSGGDGDDDESDDGSDNNDYPDYLRHPSVVFLRHLFEQQIVSPNLPTHLAFGGGVGCFRITAGHQRLSIWQHFLCFWVTMAAVSGDFASEGDISSEYESSNYPDERWRASSVLDTFIRNGADLQLTLKIGDPSSCKAQFSYGDVLAYPLEMVPDDGEAIELYVVIDIALRDACDDGYPYGPVWKGIHKGRTWPSSPLRIRDWIDRSRLLDKDVLLKLIEGNQASQTWRMHQCFSLSEGEEEDVRLESDAV